MRGHCEDPTGAFLRSWTIGVLEKRQPSPLSLSSSGCRTGKEGKATQSAADRCRGQQELPEVNVHASAFEVTHEEARLSPSARETINEVDFCAKVATAARPIFHSLSGGCPFSEARVEGVGSTSGRTKRKDLRFYDNNHKLLLTGEVKLPGGISAFDTELIQDTSSVRRVELRNS